MSGHGPAPNDLEFYYVLDCPCGTTLTGDTEDEIVDVAFAHLNEQHPDMADHYEREHVLFMARRLVKT
jgi:predicted small metal-binding protein